MPNRKQITWSLQENRPDYPVREDEIRFSDVELIFTRRGIEVNGWYDSFVGIGPTVLITWKEVDDLPLPL